VPSDIEIEKAEPIKEDREKFCTISCSAGKLSRDISCQGIEECDIGFLQGDPQRLMACPVD